MPNKRFNLSIPAPHWEDSPSISTYCALETTLLDSFFRLHRRPAARGYRAYRGSVLLNPPDDYPAPVVLLSAAPPFLAELCQRKHNKLVLACSFNQVLLNDADSLTMAPAISYALGMDQVHYRRSHNHLKKMHAMGLPMSLHFKGLAGASVSSLPYSEGEWEPPALDTSVLGLPPVRRQVHDSDSDREADPEEDKALAATADTSRHRGKGTRWDGRMRHQ